MKFDKYLILAISLVLAACSLEPNDVPTPQGPVTVGFVVGDDATRTTINEDGISTSWEADDRIALWATSSSGTATLSAQPFDIYYRDGRLAMFTATLSSVMETDTYDYYATYPIPNSVSGTKATFTMPATQTGVMADGAAILVAQPTQGPQLGIVTNIPNSYEISESHLSLTMKHATHALKFYVPSTKWGFSDSEKIERIQFIMPQVIAGDLTLDYSNLDAATTTANTSNTITLNLDKTIGASASAAALDYACAAIIPTAAFAAGDKLEVRTFTASHAARHYISLEGRGAMQAGHITPVAVNCTDVVDRHTIRFVWAGNNLGEDVHTITFRATAGNEIYKITDVAKFVKKGIHDVDFTFEDKSYLASIAGQQIVAEYESENAIVSNTITMPSDVATSIKCHEIPIVVPYLFEEYFDTLTTYDGDYTAGPHTSVNGASSTARDLSQYGLSSGWSGARTGCNAKGTAILVSARRDKVALGATNAYGRLESPALSGIKSGKKVNVKVSFTYSGGRSGNSKFASTAVCGYTTDTGLLNGYATQFNDNISFQGITGYSTLPTLPTSGSAAAATTPMEYSIANCASNYRLSWHIVHLETSYVFISNGYGMLYIDNVKVQIVK